MTARHATPARLAARHARDRRRHPLLRAGALGVVAVLAFGVSGAATAYQRFQGNISSADIDHLLGDRPQSAAPDDPNAGGAVNILVMGSDSRADGVARDRVEGMRSDTTILVHLSEDRDRAELISIPRDSLVDIPECERSDGTSSSPRVQGMFNDAFARGGVNGEVTDAAACTVKTVEQTTGVYVDHFVVVDMSGFIDMIDALGGVPMCIPQDMRSEKANLDLKAGNRVLDGRTALAFARARTGDGVGDGSDIGRIGRQQELIAATARTALGKNLFTDVPELLRFLDAATSALTVSRGISSIPDMAGLALSLRSLGPGDITLLTIPNVPAPSDPNRVVWTEEAAEVWTRVAADEPVVVDEPEPTGTPSPSGTTEPGATPEPTPSSTPRPGIDPFTPEDTSSRCGVEQG